jgi:hypothetical protein
MLMPPVNPDTVMPDENVKLPQTVAVDDPERLPEKPVKSTVCVTSLGDVNMLTVSLPALI